MNPLTDILPPSARQVLYAVYALIGVVFGSLQIVAQNGTPGFGWVATALVVFAYVGGAFGLTAGSNVTDNTTAEPLLDTEPAPEVHPDDQTQPKAGTSVADVPDPSPAPAPANPAPAAAPPAPPAPPTQG